MFDNLILSKNFFHEGAIVFAALVMLIAALNDVRTYRISNGLCLALAGFFPLFVLTAPHEVYWTQHLLVAGAVLLVGFSMFALGLLGAGDVKMLTATALWAGPKLIATLLVITTIAGGLLAAAFAGAALWHKYAGRKNMGEKELESGPWHKTPVPYGVAIACGGVSALLMMAGTA